ncbi:MAG: TolC family protein [Nitrospira sp.]|nr:TolC family protein [Nitrospira sp.]
MNFRSSTPQHLAMMIAVLWGIASPPDGWSLDVTQPIPTERRETVSLADAAVRALQHNLDITISRHTKESRLADIIVEQSKFDPTLSVNGQYNRTVNPLNRPVFGGTLGVLNEITTFDQRSNSFTFDASTNLITGGNFDINYSPARSSINQNVARGFLFNPSWTGGLAFTFTQPLLRNAGIEINKTFIRVAQNNAEVEQHVFQDRVMTVVATVEQTYWELVFANENLHVAQAAMKAAEELLATNRAKAKAGIMSIVDVLQAEAAVASRVSRYWWLRKPFVIKRISSDAS